MRFVQVNRLELDELWSYVGKKQRKVKQTDPADLGDQYVFIGIDATRKAIISYRVGKRDSENTNAFLADLRQRIVNRPEISSDGFSAYPDSVERAFGMDCSFAQIIKQYHGEPAIDTARRYSPGVVVGIQRRWVIGAQRKVCTSYVERGNLSVRMASRRFTRLTNGFSKKLANHVAAVSLYVAHFNLCRVHESLRITPAIAMGITDHIWTIGELVDAATAEPPIGASVSGEAVIEAASMSREKPTVTVVPVATPLAAFAGVVETIVGGVVFAVVNVHTYGEPIGLPFAPVIEPSKRAV